MLLEEKEPSHAAIHCLNLLTLPSTAEPAPKGQKRRFPWFFLPKGAERVALYKVLSAVQLHLMQLRRKTIIHMSTLTGSVSRNFRLPLRRNAPFP